MLFLTVSLRLCAVEEEIATRIEQGLVSVVGLKAVAYRIGENNMLYFLGIAMRLMVLAKAMGLADGQREIAPQPYGLSKHGDTLGCTGKFSGQKHFLQRVAYCSVHTITRTARLTARTRCPWSAHRVREYKQVVPRVRFVLLSSGHNLISCAYLDIRTFVGILAHRW